MRLQEDLGLIVVNLCGILKVTILRFKMCQASLRAFDTQEEIPCCLRGHTLITLACFWLILTDYVTLLACLLSRLYLQS